MNAHSLEDTLWCCPCMATINKKKKKKKKKKKSSHQQESGKWNK